MSAVGAEDKELDMVMRPHGWAPKEDGPNSNSMVVTAADMVAEEAAYAVADKEVDAEVDLEAYTETTKVINRWCSSATTTGTTAGHVDMTHRRGTTEKHLTITKKSTKKWHQNTIQWAASRTRTTRQ